MNDSRSLHQKQTLSGLQNKIVFESRVNCLIERLLLSYILIIGNDAEDDIKRVWRQAGLQQAGHGNLQQYYIKEAPYSMKM